MAQKMYSEIQLDLEIKGYIAALEKAKQANAKLKADYEKKINGMNKKSDDLMASFRKMAGVIGASFGTQQIIAFGKELVTLAANAQGIQTAFEKLDDPSLLANLRKATRGTVDDITLMSNAVQAKNLGIPIQHLSTLFQFASERARATGENVDYLVNSLVLGLGRKSTLRLDNVGLSIEMLNKRIAESGDFFTGAFSVIQDEMKKSGEYIETAADQIDKLKTSWKNLKVEVGDKLLSSGVQKELEDAVALVKALNDGERAGETLKAKLRDVADTIVGGKGGKIFAAVVPGIDAFRNADMLINKVFGTQRWDQIKSNIDLREQWRANAVEAEKFFNNIGQKTTGGAIGKPWQMVPSAPFQVAPSAAKDKTLGDLKAQLAELEAQTDSFSIKNTQAITAHLRNIEAIKAQIKALTELNTKVDDLVFGNGYNENQVQAAVEWEQFLAERQKRMDDEVFGEGYWQAQVQAAAEWDMFMEEITNNTIDYTAAINELEGVMGSLIRSSMDGWESFGETFKNIFKDLMAKLITLIATYTVLNILSGGTFAAATSLGSFIKQGFGIVPKVAGGGSSAIGGGLELRVKGTGMATAVGRGNNILWKNT